MTFKELALKLKTTVQNVPALVDVLSDAFSEIDAGGSGVKYSTTEQKIGTWTDDKDLYQLTVFADGADSSSYQNILELPADTYNIKELNYVFESAGGEVITGVWANAIMWQCAVAVSSNKRYLMIKRQTSDAGWRTVKLTCTIKYTKS